MDKRNHIQEDGIIEDLLNITDSEESSSSSDSGVFGSQQPFVLELHDVVKDEQTASNNSNQPARPELKGKNKKRKKKEEAGSNQTQSNASSIVSETTAPSTEEHSQEEFYDARESYYGLTENPVTANPVSAELIQAWSAYGPVPKLTPEQEAIGQPAQSQPGLGSQRQTFTTKKPPTRPQ